MWKCIIKRRNNQQCCPQQLWIWVSKRSHTCFIVILSCLPWLFFSARQCLPTYFNCADDGDEGCWWSKHADHSTRFAGCAVSRGFSLPARCWHGGSIIEGSTTSTRRRAPHQPPVHAWYSDCNCHWIPQTPLSAQEQQSHGTLFQVHGCGHRRHGGERKTTPWDLSYGSFSPASSSSTQRMLLGVWRRSFGRCCCGCCGHACCDGPRCQSRSSSLCLQWSSCCALKLDGLWTNTIWSASIPCLSCMRCSWCLAAHHWRCRITVIWDQMCRNIIHTNRLLRKCNQPCPFHPVMFHWWVSSKSGVHYLMHTVCEHEHDER